MIPCRVCNRVDCECDNSEPEPFTVDTPWVNRVEIIDNTKPTENDTERGRVYVKWENNIKVTLSFQDDDRTLKVFIDNK